MHQSQTLTHRERGIRRNDMLVWHTFTRTGHRHVAATAAVYDFRLISIDVRSSAVVGCTAAHLHTKYTHK